MRHTLQTVFGHSDFRPGQEAVIQHLLQGHSALAVFPTGAGKSICFQLPALLLDGLTLVVSPLIALMKDQIDALKRRGIAAARIDSTLTGQELHEIDTQLKRRSLKLLYVAPERLHNERFLAKLSGHPISLLAIDEAHCISEWGHNFRPEYLRLPQVLKALKIPRVLAVTATATPAIAAEIAATLGISPEGIFRTPFHRPNLEIYLKPGSEEDRLQRLQRALQTGANLVYVTTQKEAERVAEQLTELGMPALAYHAGMPNEDRARVQDAFMQGSERIVVATIAFGMGVDKSNLRSVVHYNLPKNLENYAQEIGRSGRDGLPARCTLLAAPSDLIPLQNFIYGDTPDSESLYKLVEELPPDEFALSLFHYSRRYDIRIVVLETAFSYLELDGKLQSTGAFYTDYQIRWVRPQSEVLALFDRERAGFLVQLFERGRRSFGLLHLHMESVLKNWDQPRQRIVAALGYLEQQGHIRVKTTGAMRGYRRLSEEVDVDRLVRRFREREERDLERLHEVWRFAQCNDCASQRLAAYFGETRSACGSCGNCLGQTPALLTIPRKVIPLAAIEKIPEHPALERVRQQTRFLCGIASPAATAAKLHRLPGFGALQHLPFSDVLSALAIRAA